MAARKPNIREQDSGDALVALPLWDDLIGMDDVLVRWRQLVAAERLPTVILLTGRDGIGKRALLSALAAMHVCETGVACGTCRPCLWHLSGAHPEVLWVQGDDGKILLEQTRALQDHLSLSATSDVKARVAIMVDVDQMSLQAANSLLKTLEEPPPRTRILMSTSRPQALPDTVLSRCVRWRISPPEEATSRAWLSAKLAEKNVVTTDVMLAKLLKAAGLAPGRALRLGLGEGFADMPSLFGAPTIGAALRIAEVWARESGLSAGALLVEAEMGLNQYYADGAGEAAARPALNVDQVRQIRAAFIAAKELALRGKVPLNGQLVMERLATAGACRPASARKA